MPFAFDLTKSFFQELALLGAGVLANRQGIEPGHNHRQERERKTGQPINHKSQFAEMIPKQRLARHQHTQRRQQEEHSQPAPSLLRQIAHADTVLRDRPDYQLAMS